MIVDQVPRHRRWPSGDSRDLAEIRLTPSELAQRFQLNFEELFDDLDWFKVAAIRLGDSSQVWLYRYRNDPSPGTAIRIDAAADFAEAKAQLKQLLELKDEDFLWVAPGAEASAALA